MMTLTVAYILLGFAILSEVIATSALKASYGMTRLAPGVIVIIGYMIAFYLMALSLKVLPVGFVYAIWAGLGIIGVAIVGAVLFDEAFTASKIAGMALIVVGVILVKGTSP